MTLNHMTLAEVDSAYRNGSASETEVQAYLALWNTPVHFTHAYLADGCIRQHDPEQGTAFRCAACYYWRRLPAEVQP
jgi:hypothetical protein